MNIQLGNIWYFLFLFASFGIFTGLYFLLRKKSEKTIKIVLSSLMIFALVLHFLKGLYPPYSLNYEIHLRDSWFINICGANIALFPFILLSKNKHLKDYMFYIGVLSGLIAIFYPIDPMMKADQSAEWMDAIRFYIHHNLLWYCPLLMVLLKVHTIDYRRVWSVPISFLMVMLFIMLNQVLQSELGFISLERDGIHHIPYVNNSLIWGPDGNISKLIDWACPKIFKTIPVGPHQGETKYWPWFWLVVPCFVIVTPLCFAISMIFEHKHFKEDIIKVINYFKNKKQEKGKC